jgi:putative transposase
MPDRQATPAPDRVERAFAPEQIGAPNKLWVADITYVPTAEGWLYLATVLDAFSRACIGWSMADHLRTELVLDALDMAISQRQPAPGLVHHADHGCQYTSLAFGRRLREAGLVASMGTVGDALDNAVAESFFATLECELLDRHRFATRSQARTAVFDYLEGFYNPAVATPPSATSAPPSTKGGTPPAILPPDPASPRCLPDRGNFSHDDFR